MLNNRTDWNVRSRVSVSLSQLWVVLSCLRGRGGRCGFAGRRWWDGPCSFCSIADPLLRLLFPLLHRGEVLLQQAAVRAVRTGEAAVKRAEGSHRLRRIRRPAAQETVLLRCLLITGWLEARVGERGVCGGWVRRARCDRRGGRTQSCSWDLSRGDGLTHARQLLLHRLLPMLHRLELQGEHGEMLN